MIKVENLSYTYAGSDRVNLNNMDLEIERGEFILLTGPSGCGKTTLTRVLNGLIPHYYEGKLMGDATLDGVSYKDMSLFAISEKVGSVFQNPKTQFFNVDTTSEMAFGAENHGVAREEILKRISDTATFMEAQHLMNRNIFSLSGGEKQKIACGSTSVMDPECYIFDEPSSNLDSDAARDLRRVMLELKNQGKTMIVAEHRLSYLSDLADKVIIMKDGSILRSYTGEEFSSLSDDEREKMGLRPIKLEKLAELSNPVNPDEEDYWKVENLRFTYPCQHKEALHIDEIKLPKGRVTAVIGHNGAGKTTFLRCLTGLQKHSGGILRDGSRSYGRKQRIRQCFMVMQDVNHQLFTESVLEEVMLSQPVEDEKKAEEILARMDLLPLKDRHPMSLSGGQKQRLAVATAYASDAPIVVFDEPTSGLDLEHMKEVAGVLDELSTSGRTVVVVTHDPELILRSADRVVQLEGGKAVGTYSLDTVRNRERLLSFFSERGKVRPGENEKAGNPLSVLWKWAEGKQAKFVLSIILAVMGSISQLIPYFCIGSILMKLFDGVGNLESYLLPAGIALAFFALKVLLSSFSTVISHKAAYDTLASLRLKCIQKLQKVPMGTLLDTDTAAYKGLIVDRIEAMEVPFAHLMPELTANIVSPLLMLLVMFLLDWRLTLLSLIPMVVSFVIMGVGMRNYGEEGAGALAATEKMTSAITEYISGIEVIKAFSQSAGSYRKYSEAVKGNADYYISWMKKSQKTMCTYNAILPSVLLTVLPGGLLLWNQGSLTPVTLLTFAVLSIGFISAVSEAFSFASSMALLGKYVGDLEELLDAPELNHGNNEVEIRDTSVVFENVDFSYDGEREVLHGIDLRMEPNSMTALVGPSGSGKSTVARLIAGFWDVTGGRILLGGCPLEDIPVSELNQMISCVTQDNFLFNRSIRENIRMGKPGATDEEVEEAARRCGCDEFIRSLENGYDTVAGTGGSDLSGGERQRIEIARAMLKDAPIIILDEATAYMDPENERRIQSSIAELTRGKTLIVIAHRLSTVTGADQIILVNDGNVEASGTHEELLGKSPLYKAMWLSHISSKDEAKEGK